MLKQALDRDYQFIIEDILDGRGILTDKMVELIWIEKQFKLLASLIAPNHNSNSVRPKYIDLKVKNKKEVLREILNIGVNLNSNYESKIRLKSQEDPEITTIEIIRIGLELKVK